MPHLESGGEFYGEIGKKTKFKDAIGRELCIGDVVEYFDKGNISYGDTVIVESVLQYYGNRNKQFVMGIECSCNDDSGEISGWKIIKKRSFEEVKNGEGIYGIKYVTEEKNN